MTDKTILRELPGYSEMRARAGDVISLCSGRPHIFNLGHGIVPQAPPEHVATLLS